MHLVGWGTQVFSPQHISYKLTKFIHAYFLTGLYLHFTEGKPKARGAKRLAQVPTAVA